MSRKDTAAHIVIVDGYENGFATIVQCHSP